MIKHLYLDLEYTTIGPVYDGWANVELCNMDIVRRVISNFQPDHVHIFSFALQTEFDLTSFNEFVRPRLEESLERKIVSAPLTSDMLRACAWRQGLDASALTFKDLVKFWHKQEAFKCWIRSNTAREPTEAWFLDDDVFRESGNYPNLNLSYQIFNIDEL